MEAARRALKAILFSDIKSFSAMMEKDEEGTVELVREHRAIFRSKLERFGGQERGTSGDSFFVLFDSAIAAVHCAIEIQEALRARNLTQPPERHVTIRIGLHMGDIILDSQDDDVFGEAVNIAARTEPKAEPGGICVTDAIARQCARKIKFPFRSAGRLAMKNIADVPELFHVDFLASALRETQESTVDAPTPPSNDGKTAWRRPWRKWVFLFFSLLLLAILGWMVDAWQKRILARLDPLATVREGTLLVAPFENTTGKADDDWLRYGIAQTLETKLAELKKIKVFSHQLLSRDCKEATAADLVRANRIQLLVSGSFQKIEQEVRLLVRLEDTAEAGRILFSHNETGPIGDILKIQDRVALALARKLGLDNQDKEQAISRVGPSCVKAYRLYSQGIAALYAGRQVEAVRLLGQARRLDPRFKRAQDSLRETFASCYFFRLSADGVRTTLTQVYEPAWSGSDSFFIRATRQKVVRAWDSGGHSLPVNASLYNETDWGSEVRFLTPALKGYPLRLVLELENEARLRSFEGIFFQTQYVSDSWALPERTYFVELPEGARLLFFDPLPLEKIEGEGRDILVFHSFQAKSLPVGLSFCFTLDERAEARFKGMSPAQRREFFQRSGFFDAEAGFFETFQAFTALEKNSTEREFTGYLNAIPGDSLKGQGEFYRLWLQGFQATRREGGKEEAKALFTRALTLPRRQPVMAGNLYLALLDEALEKADPAAFQPLLDLELTRLPWIASGPFFPAPASGTRRLFLSKTLRDQPGNLAARLDLAAEVFASGEPAEALKIVDQNLDNPYSLYFPRLGFTIALSRGDFPAINRYLRCLIAAFPLSRAWIEHATLLIQAGRPGEALAFTLSRLREFNARSTPERLRDDALDLLETLHSLPGFEEEKVRLAKEILVGGIYWTCGSGREFRDFLYGHLRKLSDAERDRIPPNKMASLGLFLYVGSTPTEAEKVFLRQFVLDACARSQFESLEPLLIAILILEREKEYRLGLEYCQKVQRLAPDETISRRKKVEFEKLLGIK